MLKEFHFTSGNFSEKILQALLDVEKDPMDASAYDGLASALNYKQKITLRDGRVMNRQQLYLEAIKCDTSYCNPYNNLALTLEHDDKITLPDGRVIGALELYLESIAKEPANPEAYYNLGCTIVGNNTITLQD